MSYKWLSYVFAFLLVNTTILASPTNEPKSSAEIYHQVLKLKETKRVLYVAAHPDDENTRLISFLGNEIKAEVAYLSLTRGDGGQNLIGKELGIELGMIRTQELLKARQIDRGRQFFSRAIDFGFSKHPEETFKNWEKDKLLNDVVWVIRTFQPDIIITRFNTEPGSTHGHHTGSAILAGEAFSLAADSSAYPGHLPYTTPWQSKRIFWNAYNWGGAYEPEEGKLYHQYPVGNFNSLLGMSYSQMAADSRTMHKSQGFGSTAQIGNSEDYLQMVAGERFTSDPFEGVQNRWESIKNGKVIEGKIDRLLDTFDHRIPSQNIPQLISIKKELDKINLKEAWIIEKQSLIDEIILNAMGIIAEFNSNKELSYPGEVFKTQLIFNNPSSKELKLIDFSILDKTIPIDIDSKNNQTYKRDINITLPKDYPISQPYWLEDENDGNLFKISNQQAIGKPFNEPAVAGVLNVEIEKQLLRIDLPLKYKYNDPIDGEVNQPFTIIPEVSVKVKKNNLFLIKGQSNHIEIEVGFQGDVHEGNIIIDGLKDSEYKVVDQRTDEDKAKKIFTVEVFGKNDNAEKIQAKAIYVLNDGISYDQDIRRIKYKHIPNLTHFPASQFNILNLDITLSAQRIGYIPGAGDEVPEVLKELGYEVTYLEEGSLQLNNLKSFSTIITGIRAFNVNEDLANHMDQLLKYVHEGGNLIVQYNTSSPLLTSRLGPYDITLSRDRVTVEDSPVEIEKGHSLFSEPNQISDADFDNWVQERGLYFPGEWDERYNTPLTLHEPGESSKEGSLLISNYGEGTYSYSGLSWFRLLPAGVPGAIKLFVNLIEQ
ncbi:PIG-L family deacetylase [Anditalea andensis]|uniref:LmbE family protein n=1 Tax=Anditalea andensis TaxID=1048983 RepID=A0A074LJP4_9BACT|nr:PIG-L family deacetylase [Anditalea andensis]KEO74022.1 LmbE family protein [Anditalea andensis]